MQQSNHCQTKRVTFVKTQPQLYFYRLPLLDGHIFLLLPPLPQRWHLRRPFWHTRTLTQKNWTRKTSACRPTAFPGPSAGGTVPQKVHPLTAPLPLLFVLVLVLPPLPPRARPVQISPPQDLSGVNVCVYFEKQPRCGEVGGYIDEKLGKGRVCVVTLYRCSAGNGGNT